MKAILLCTELCRPGKNLYDSPDPWSKRCRSAWFYEYFAHGFYILQVFLANFLTLLRVKVKLVKTFVEELV